MSRVQSFHPLDCSSGPLLCTSRQWKSLIRILLCPSHTTPAWFQERQTVLGSRGVEQHFVWLLSGRP